MGSHGAAVASEKPSCIFLSSPTMKLIQVAISWFYAELVEYTH
jgi:hypothetical protein